MSEVLTPAMIGGGGDRYDDDEEISPHCCHAYLIITHSIQNGIKLPQLFKIPFFFRSLLLMNRFSCFEMKAVC